VRHALVIGEDQLAEQIVEARLWEAGFSSVAHAWDEQDAWIALRNRHPALIVVLADSAQPLTSDALCRMSEEADAPVLVATANAAQAVQCLGAGASLEGPFAIDELEEAVTEAAAPEPSRPLAACF
jgi:DNA-binding response OmpR family regulator